MMAAMPHLENTSDSFHRDILNAESYLRRQTLEEKRILPSWYTHIIEMLVTFAPSTHCHVSSLFSAFDSTPPGITNLQTVSMILGIAKRTQSPERYRTWLQVIQLGVGGRDGVVYNVVCE